MPSPPLTVPDVQNSRIRFFTGELRSRRCRHTVRDSLVKECAQVECVTSRCHLAKSAIRCPSVDRFAGFRVPSRVSGQRFSPRDASLPSVGSRRAQFPDIKSTMKALRLPVCAFLVPYGFGSRLHVLLRVRVRRSAPGAAEDRFRAWGSWSAGPPRSGDLHMGTHGISQVSWRSIPCLCPVPRPRPDRQNLALIGPVDAAPGTATPKAPAKSDLGAQPRALASAAYASRAVLPPPMQGSLPAGGLRPLPGGS